ncbi:MAG: ketoacyl-ACP synthase III [Patescibacteria group bacterium]
MQGVRIAGLGIALPKRIVTNDDIARMYLEERECVLASGIMLTDAEREVYETSDEWILSRTGIKERRFAEPGETTSDYAMRAAHEAWTDAYGDGLELPEFFILGTVSPDHPQTPPTSAVALRKMHFPPYRNGLAGKRLRNCITMDVSYACTTPMAALSVGCALIQSGTCKRGIVALADIMSSTTGRHHRARSPFAILGDAGAAYALEACAPEHSWFKNPPVFMGGDGGIDGVNENRIKTLAGGSAVPLLAEHLDPRRDDHLMFMDGRTVFEDIVPHVNDRLVPDALEFFGLTIEDVDVITPHQANKRMSEAVVKRLAKQYPHVEFRMATRDCPEGIPFGKSTVQKTHTIIWYDNIDHFGNTTSPATALCTYEARELELIKPGTRIMQIAFGGGYSWGSTYFTWR